jgi:hypothetical protein
VREASADVPVVVNLDKLALKLITGEPGGILPWVRRRR